MTNLDYLVIVAGGILAAGIALLVLLAVTKRRWPLYAAAGLGLYLGYVGLRINAPGFPVQCILAVALALAGVTAVVLERRDMGKVSRTLAALSVLGGMMNAFVI